MYWELIVKGNGRDVANGSRFHAWQSALLFSSLFVLHLILSWSKFLSWTLFVIDILLIGYLTFRAYRDGRFGPWPLLSAC
jgi:uncharacterized membrane protein